MKFGEIKHILCQGYPTKSLSQSLLVLNGNLVTIGFMAFYAIVSFFLEFTIGIHIQLILIAFFSLTFLMMYKKVSLDIIGNYIALVGFTGVIVLCYYSGRFNSPVLPWLCMVPIVSLLFSKSFWAFIWFIVVILFIASCNLYFSVKTPAPVAYNLKFYDLFYILSILGLISVNFLMNFIYKQNLNQSYTALEAKNEEIVAEKTRADKLLLNILPEKITKDLKACGKTEPKLYDQVSILFIDFVGFTKYCEQMSPTHLVETLDFYFQKFDEIIGKYNLEKIKTIGDAYLAVCGVPDKQENHALNVVKAAKEIKSFIEMRIRSDTDGIFPLERLFNYPAMSARIGIHSGTVIAGIIGAQKFAFDIWGDAVNIAARIQQIGFENKINLSSETYNLVRDTIPCEYKGKFSAKNKGELDIYNVI